VFVFVTLFGHWPGIDDLATLIGVLLIAIILTWLTAAYARFTAGSGLRRRVWCLWLIIVASIMSLSLSSSGGSGRWSLGVTCHVRLVYRPLALDKRVSSHW
jgi:hypothetical protein